MSARSGEGTDSRLIYQQATSATTPIQAIFPLAPFDSASLHLVCEQNTRTVVVTGTDSVVASTGTWTFANANFTANDVGGTITVAGATNGGNNGTFTILTRVSATQITTATAGLVNETFSAVVSLIVTGAAVTGAWKVELSNDWARQGLYQNVTSGYWSDVTALFANTGSPFFPAIVAVSAAYPAASGNQYSQMAPCGARSARVTFTPATKAGLISIYKFARSWSY